MHRFVKLFPLLLVSFVLLSCEGDYRREALGGFGEAVVVMDSTQWDSETAEAIRMTYGRGIDTLPNMEPLFDLRFTDFNNNARLETIKQNKNIIIAAPLTDTTNVANWIKALLSDEVEQQVRAGESFAFPFENRWYRNQWSIILTAPTDSALAHNIRIAEQTLVQSLMEKELTRWTYEIYDKGEKLALEDSLWQSHGWKIRVQHDWYKNVDTAYTANGEQNHILTMRRVLPQNDRWFWAWWKEDVHNIDFLDAEWINSKRDSLMEQWIRGTRDSSYVTTEYRRPVKTHPFELNKNLAYETLGTWRMTHDAMGGPFVNLTIYDEDTRRLFMLEFGQFAPKYNKRRFVRQFRAMLRTFRSDSTWNNSTQSMANE